MNKGPYTSERIALRELLRAVREEAGVSQGELAQRLGVPQSLVSRFERGDRRMDLQELREVCQALGVSLATFVRRYEERLVD